MVVAIETDSVGCIVADDEVAVVNVVLVLPAVTDAPCETCVTVGRKVADCVFELTVPIAVAAVVIDGVAVTNLDEGDVKVLDGTLKLDDSCETALVKPIPVVPLFETVSNGE